MNRQVDQADLIVFLLSPDFFAFDECMRLMERALARQQLVLVPLLFLASLAAPTRQNQNAPSHGPSGALGRTKRGPPLPCKVSQGRANHTVCCLKSGNSIFLPLFRTHMGGSFWQCQKDPFFKSGSHFGWAKNGVGGCGRWITLTLGEC
jgi:hypothetical protein